MLAWLRRLFSREPSRPRPQPMAPEAAAAARDPEPLGEQDAAATSEPRPVPEPGADAPHGTPPAGPPGTPAEPSPTGDRRRTVKVHADRLDDRPAPRRLTPSEALRLANEGPGALEDERDG